MFKWIISLLLIIISLPIIYFNITSFYQAKKDFQAQNQVVVAETSDKNTTKKTQKRNTDNYSSFDKEFEKEWNNF
jgi:biopolymer transport protein ExbB/TolQ